VNGVPTKVTAVLVIVIMVRACVCSDNVRASASVFSRVHMHEACYNSLATFACIKCIYISGYLALHSW